MVSMSELLSILCIAYMWYPVMVINNQMLNVRGRSDYFLKAEIIKKIVAIVILLLTMPLGLKTYVSESYPIIYLIWELL